MLDSDRPQGLRDFPADVVGGNALHQQGQRHIVENGLLRQEPKVLEHRSHLAAQIRNIGLLQCRHIFLMDEDLPLIGPLGADEQPQ